MNLMRRVRNHTSSNTKSWMRSSNLKSSSQHDYNPLNDLPEKQIHRAPKRQFIFAVRLSRRSPLSPKPEQPMSERMPAMTDQRKYTQRVEKWYAQK